MVEDGYGETIMSREKAKRTKVWSELEAIQNSQEIIEGKVCGKVKGGFTVELMNIKAFYQGLLSMSDQQKRQIISKVKF